MINNLTKFFKSMFLGILPKRLVSSIRSYRLNAYRSRRNQAIISNLISSKAPIRLELGGAANRLKGWISIGFAGDIVLDLRKGIPFPDNTIEEIYASHMLEHLYHDEIIKLLSDCYRALKPNGIIRVCVPNAAIFLKAYSDHEKFDAAKYVKTKWCCHYHSKIDYVNYIAYMANDHRHMFDSDNLLAILSQVGFSDVGLRNFEPALDLETHKDESIYAYAKK